MSALQLRLCRTDRLQIGAQTYRLQRETPAALSFANVEDPDDLRTFSHADLARRLTQPDARLRVEEEAPGSRTAKIRAAHRYIATMPAQKQALLLWKLSYVQAHRVLCRKGRVGRSERSVAKVLPQIMALAENRSSRRTRRAGALLPPQRQPPSAGTLLAWIREVDRAGGDPLALARKQGSGKAGPRVDPEVGRIVAAQIESVYLTLQRPPVARLVEAIEDRVQDENQRRAERGLPPLTPPSARTVRRKVALLDPFEVAVQRHGRDHAARKFGPYERGLRSERLGERVEIDEGNIDLLTFVDLVGVQGLKAVERAKMQTVRLWMVAAIDCASRVILGFKLALAPSAEEAVAVLQMIGQNKTPIAAACGASSGWDQATGVGSIICDMGSAFISDTFVAAATDLGWHWIAGAAGHPDLRGTIERMFRTFGYLLLPDLTGRLFGSPQERGDYPSEAWAALSEEELGRILTRFIVDIVHNRSHAGLMCESPARAWSRLQGESGTLPVPDATLQRAVFGLALTRRPGRHGVRFAGIDYVGRRLHDHVLHSSHLREVTIRVDPEDLGWIVVLLDGDWHPLRATNPAVEGLALADWREMVLSIRRKHRDAAALDADIIRRARRDIAAINADARARRRLGPLRVSAAQVEADERALYMGLQVLREMEDPWAPAEIAGLDAGETPERGLDADHLLGPDSDPGEVTLRPAAPPPRPSPAPRRPAVSRTPAPEEPPKWEFDDDDHDDEGG